MPDALEAKKRSEIMRGNKLISLSTVDVTRIDGKYYIYSSIIKKITNYIKSKKHKDTFFFLNVDLEMTKCIDNRSIDISSQINSNVYYSNIQGAIEDLYVENHGTILFMLIYLTQNKNFYLFL